MNLDDLKQTWKQRQGDLADSRVDQIAARVTSRSTWFENTIARRDVIEYVAIVLIFIFFVPTLLSTEPLLSRIGVLISLAGAIGIACVLYWGGRDRPSQNDLTITKFCEVQLARVDRQIWLLRNVSWWYSGPLILGAILYVIGLLPYHVTSWALAGCFLLVGIYIHRANQRAVKNELLPYRNELGNVLAQIDPDNNTSWVGTSSTPEDTASFMNTIAKKSCEKRLAGIAIGVIVDGQESTAVGGWADIESNKPVTESTVFEIGSLSKVFTSLLLAVATTKKEVELDDPVQFALGESATLPTDGKSEITFRSLANHRSSLPRLPADLLKQADKENPYVHYDQGMLYACLSEMDKVKRIGSRSAYSNFGVGLLGHALGKLAGSDYRFALKERVLVPLGMVNTSSESGDDQSQELATAYKTRNTAVRHWDFTEVTVAAGGIRASLSDMLKFLRTNVYPENSILAKELKLMRQTSDRPNPRSNANKKKSWIAPLERAFCFAHDRTVNGNWCPMLIGTFVIAALSVGLQWLTGVHVEFTGRMSWGFGIFIWRFFLSFLFVYIPLYISGMLWGFKRGHFTLLFMTALAILLWGPELHNRSGWAFELLYGVFLVWAGSLWKTNTKSSWASVVKAIRGDGRLAWQSLELDSHEVLWHNGMVGGAASFLAVVEDLKIGVVVLTNTQKLVDGIGIEILKELIRKEKGKPTL